MATTSNQIKAIDKGSVHRITSGQVVVDLRTAVKELVENSLDAGSTNIEIRLKNYGLKSIDVIDNGSGIAEEDFESIGLKHHTSKLETYEDLNVVQTFGFRGEAMSSLCALCAKVSVTTATKETSPKGTILHLRKTGEIDTREIVARQKGTTVTIENLFAPLPVRRKELERNIKREFGKALSLLHAYALGPCASSPGVRLSVANFSEKGQKSMQIQTQGAPSMRTSVTALWGAKALENVVDLNVAFEVGVEKSVIRRLQMLNHETPESINVEVKGLISSFAVNCGRLNLDRQFFYINGRPCDLPKVQKAFNEVYRTFNANQSPLIIADFTIPTEISRSSMTLASAGTSQASSSSRNSKSPPRRPNEATDGMSVDGDDRTLDVVVDTTKSPWARKILTRPVNTNQSEPRRESPPSPPSPIQPSLIIHRTNQDGGSLVPSVLRKRRQTDDEDSISQATAKEIDNNPTNRPSEVGARPVKKRVISRSMGAKLASFAMPGSQLASLPASQSEEESSDVEGQSKECGLNKDQDEGRGKEVEQTIGENDVQPVRPGSIPSSAPESHIAGDSSPIVLPPREDEPMCDGVDDDSEAEDPSSVLSSARESISVVESSSASHDRVTLDPPRTEIIRSCDSGTNVSVRFDIHKVRNRCTKVQSSLSSAFNIREGGQLSQAGEVRVPNDAGVLNLEDQVKAADALSRIIDKSDFASMDIIGQFNLGFIIARRRKPLTGRTKTMDDLFIVDQHAADEKYNFENLQLTTKIQSQKLLRPRILELTAADELVASENLPVLKNNGFEVQESDAASMGGRLRLMAQPVSKNTVFDLKDLEELIHLLRDSPSGTMVRCSKARAMFASRACRKSVMVGMPLNQTQMSTISSLGHVA
ncbi:hypothetical protein MD484_g3137, partial [Candolleomyces efflorescens]